MQHEPPTPSRNVGPGRLALCGSLVAVVWLVVFPWIAARPAVHERIQWLGERQIDASAMYYTEVEAMRPILDRLNARERRKP